MIDKDLTHLLIKFLTDNATGLSVSVFSLYLMFRLFDKHLGRLTRHLNGIEQLLVLFNARHERYQRETEKTLWRLEQRQPLWWQEPPAAQPEIE